MDFVLNKGDIAHEMFFIVDGTVYVLCSDKNTIAMTLTDGEHFGEADMFSETQRHQFYVQSVTFSTLNFLSKDQLQDIATIFPQILTKLEEAANRKQAVLDNFTTTVPAGADDHNPILVNLMNNSDSSSSPPHPRPLKTAFSQILND
jgi:CRP-like cAMP-binding protein